MWGFDASAGVGDAVDANPWVIARAEESGSLPRATTCDRTIKLPEYKNARELREKLRIAVDFGYRGFAFE